MSDRERDLKSCMGAHAMKDAIEGHPAEFCKPYLKQILAEVERLRLQEADASPR